MRTRFGWENLKGKAAREPKCRQDYNNKMGVVTSANKHNGLKIHAQKDFKIWIPSIYVDYFIPYIDELT